MIPITMLRIGLDNPNYAMAFRSPPSLDEVRVSSLRQVTLVFEHGTAPAKHIVFSINTERFVEACLELHHDPGQNPHNGETTAKIIAIRVSEPALVGPYWWSTPKLGKNPKETGAKIVEWSNEKTIWQKPEDPEEK